MTKKERIIEEIAKTIKKAHNKCEKTDCDGCKYIPFKNIFTSPDDDLPHCKHFMTAEFLYNRGYRQWIHLDSTNKGHLDPRRK